MALTGLTNLQPLHIKTVGIGTFDNTVSIGGTLTYEDVTNVDAIGIITARSGINVSAGQLDVGNNIKLGNAGVITATSFAGSGANLTGVLSNIVEDTSPQLGGDLASNNKNILLPDSTGTNRIKFGTNEDLQIYHNGNNNKTYIGNKTSTDLLIENAGTNTDIVDDTGHYRARFIKDGAVELYHNNVKKFETAADRVNITGHIFMLGGNRIYLQNGFQNSYASINNIGGSNDSNLNFYVRNAGTESTALKIQKNGNIELPVDSQVLNLGASQDMQLYHNGTDSYILNATGNFRIGQYNNANLKFFTNNSTRWEINGSGHFLPDANNSFDIGSTSLRVRNIYTNDLNLSNKGSTNSVDNTWGDYTIQEGESDLFLINNRNGKKYKFNLTEVS